MDIKTVNGYLLFADISGFERYLVDVELDHAHDIIKDLLQLLARNISPTFSVAAYQTDAVYAHAPTPEKLNGGSLLEMLETTYADFRNRIQSMHRGSTCTCQACQNVPQLDLKFMVHFAEYTTQTMRGQLALGGLDANLMQKRKFKEQVPKGQHGYALFTEASLAKLGLARTGMQTYSAEYPEVGKVSTNVLDLEARYQEYVKRNQPRILSDEADMLIEGIFDIDPATMWDWLNEPEKRSEWMEGKEWEAGLRIKGQIDVGAVNHCDHESGKLKEIITAWQPYEFFTVNQIPERMPLLIERTYAITEISNEQVKLSLRTKYRGLLGWMRKSLSRYETEGFQTAFEKLDMLIKTSP